MTRRRSRSDLPVLEVSTASRGQVGSLLPPPGRAAHEGGRSHRLASLAFSRRIRWSPLRQALIELGRQT